MVDNLRGGDPGRPPQALSPSRPQPGPQEGGYLSLDSSNNGNPAPRSPSRSADDEYDFQMNNFSLLKAQLKLVTHERDMLKKDVKKITMERDGALKHLSLTTGNMELGGHHHHRTASDTASGTSTSAKPVKLEKYPTELSVQMEKYPIIGSKSGRRILVKRAFSDGKSKKHKGQSSTLSRSHSIASAGDKSLILSTVSSTSNASSPPTMHHQSSRHELSNERLLHELQITKKQLGDALKKNEQTHKDAEFYHAEAESIRTRYNDMLIEKQRSEQEVASLRLFMDEERKEMAEMRRQQQEVLNVDGGEPLSLMYSQLLQNYENVKDEYSLLRKRYDDLAASHSAAVSKLEHSQEEISRYKKMYNDVLIERNQFKQQCTQAIRQWDQALREKTEYKDALTKVKRQHDDAIKEINQAMTVRIKASKDLKRLTEERNAAMQEYSLIMSERDSVHKDIEKMQEELKEKNKKLSNQESRSKHYEDDKRKLTCKIEMLKRELEQSLHERDKAMKETHEIRERVGGKTSADHEHSKNVNKHRFGDIDRNKKDRDFASTETIDTSALASKKERLDNLDQANAEIEKLRKLGEKLTGELQEATMEADVAKGRRDWAFSERDKVVLERESIRTLCDKLRRERDRAVSELAEALRDSDDIKKDRNETQKENKDLRERLEIVEKSLRMKSLQRSTGHSHSHDSAIDSDLQEWETETLDLDMAALGSQEDLLLDLAGGRDDLHCPVADKPIYVSSIAKGSFLEGKLKVNDCILRVNNVDCRDIDRSTLIHTLKTSSSTVNLLVKRRRVGKRYNTTLNLNGSYHGISLELGAYVAKIQPGSVAAKEGSIAVGDRIVGINDQALDHLENINDALKLLESNSVLSLTLAKSYNAINHILGGPLSSSSSGQNMQVVDNLDNDNAGHGNSKKSLSATTSPIKDTIRGSQEMIRKLISKSDRSSHGLSSSSSEKVYSVNTSQNSNQHSKSSKESSRNKLIDTVKEKFDNVTRGKRRGSSKEPSMEAHLHVHSDHDIVEDHVASSNEKGGPGPGAEGQRADMAIAELDSVINSYNSASSGTKSSGNGGSKKKRSKDRDSFRSGGTWPRTRGGPIIEHGTGTILHPQKQKKERLPLAELLSNLPKYPPEAAKVPYRANEAWSRSTRDHTRRSRPVTTYDMLENYGSNVVPNTASPYRMLSEMGGGPRSSTGSREPSTDHQLQSKAYLSPSDTSIDESVKSAQAGKDVLEQYLKKSKANTLKSASSGLNTNVVPPSTSSIGDLMESVVGSPPPAMPPTGSSYFKSEYNSHLIRPQATPNSMSGFSPYYSSPKYSTPPLPSSESMLGSPIPDFTNQSKFYHPYDSQATGSQPHSLTSVSPTSGLYHQRGHSPSPSQGIEYLMAKTRGHSSHYGPIPPYSGYPGYAYPTSSSSHQPSSYLTQQQLQQHQGYHHRPAIPTEETSPPPVYEYLSTSRPGKDNYKFRTDTSSKVRAQVKSGTYPRKRKDRDAMRQSPKSDKTAQKENSPRIGSAGAAGTGSGSGTEKDKSSGSAGGTKSQRSRLRSNRLPLPPTSSSSEDEYDLHKRQKSRTISSATRRNSRDNLLMTSTEYKSSTNPRKSHQKSSPKQMMSSSKQRHKSSENILEKSPKVTKSHSESEVLEDTPKNKNRENFDFTSTRKSQQQKSEAQKESDQNTSSDKSHDKFGSTEFPTLKRNFKLTPAPTPAPPASGALENEYESMTSIRQNVWTPTENQSSSKTVDGLSSPSVIVQAEQHSAKDETIEPPPNFQEEKPPPLPVKKYAIKPNRHEAQFQATLQKSAKLRPKMTTELDTKKMTQKDHDPMVLNPNQVRMASMQGQAEREAKQRHARNKRIRNRSLEMVLDENRSSDSSPSRRSFPRDRPSSRDYTRSLERPKPRRSDRIPSNTSVASHGSASTAERPFSKCSSPLPIYSVQYLLPDGRPAEHQKYPRKPHPGEIRQIYIEKSSEALGITIKENQAKKGVFVSSVSENSLANQVGLQVGDQILDVCGVNLRACGKEQAALVLQKSGNSMTLRVQYNPGEYHSMLTLASSVEDNVSDEDEHEEDDSEDESESESEEEEHEVNQHPIGATHRHSIRANPNAVVQAQAHSRSGSPTPRNSPRGSGRQGEASDRHRDRPLNVSLPPSAHSTLTRHQISQVLPHLHSHLAPGQVAQVQAPSAVHQRSVSYEQPRWVFPVLKKSGDLGVRLVGGNAVGIFIHSVDPDSAAFHEGLRQADQILEYNGIDLRQATAEQAAYELAKPAEKVTILVQYHPGKYDEIKDKPGDSYYVRAMFDRLPDPQGGPHQLAFRKDDILFIDNTMYNGVPGHWSAWLVDLDGQTGEWGIVPSKYKVDEELLKRTLDSDSDLGIGSSSNSVGATTRKTWTATRRSFFKRRKGGRSSSRESSAAKELASFSDMASLNYSDSGALHEVEPQINSYVRVERLDYMVTRPVLIIGPLNDVVTDKLISDFPHKFSKCEPKLMNLTQEALEKGIMNNVIVDFKRRGSQFECYTLAGIKEICERNQHCIVNVHMDVLERLHQNQVYPIVLLVKFKSVKQIKEIKDPRHLVEKISQKDAKNMFESTQSLEADYKPYISDTIHAGANLMLMCAQINSTIDQEQNKTLWVPSGTIW